jgi:hypothetical protein
MQDLVQRARDPRTNLAGLMQEFLSIAGSDLSPYRKHWMQLELDGYKDAIDYYLRPPICLGATGFLPDGWSGCRETPGTIKRVRDNVRGDVDHPIAAREDFFVAIPIGRIQDLTRQDGDVSILELPELSDYLCDQTGDRIELHTKRSELQRMLDAVRDGVTRVIYYTFFPEELKRLHEQLEQRYRKRETKEHCWFCEIMVRRRKQAG